MASAKVARTGEKLPPIRVVIVDDNTIFLGTIFRYITEDRGIAVLGTAQDASKGLVLITESQPDIALIDLMMPGTSGFRMIFTLKSLFPKLILVALTLHSDEIFERAALARGAHAFLKKDQLTENLLPLLHKLYQARAIERPA